MFVTICFDIYIMKMEEVSVLPENFFNKGKTIWSLCLCRFNCAHKCCCGGVAYPATTDGASEESTVFYCLDYPTVLRLLHTYEICSCVFGSIV